MKTLSEIKERSIDIILRATDRNSKSIPTSNEVKLASDVLLLAELLEWANKSIANMSKDDWEELKISRGVLCPIQN